MLTRPPLCYPRLPYHHVLQSSADRFPEQVALDFEGDTFTYRELDGIGNAFAHGLEALGIGPGDRVALLVSNRPEWLTAAHGVYQRGAAVITPNPAWKAAELRHALGLTRPRAVVAEAGLVELVEREMPGAVKVAVDEAPPGWSSFWDMVASHPGDRPGLAVDPTAEAALLFSSGTTGTPKAVRHGHAGLSAAVTTWKSATGVGPWDRMQFMLPLFGVFGLVIPMTGFAAGIRISLFRRFDLETMLRHIEAERVTICYGALPMFAAMAARPDIEDYDLSSLRGFVWGATPISGDVADAVTRRTGVGIIHSYGTTEVPPLHCNPVRRPDLWRLDSPGLPVSDLQVRVVDPETLADVEPGKTGEIVVRGPFTMLGYLPEEANVDAFLPGRWFRTGDIGWVEPDGWLHITDRAKEMLKVSGFSVAPVEVEQILFGHPDVADCAVYGVPDRRLGEAPTAAVVRRDGSTVTEPELRTWVADRLATYKQVRRVVFVDAIPRNPAGKVLRRVLRADDSAAGDGT